MVPIFISKHGFASAYPRSIYITPTSLWWIWSLDQICSQGVSLRGAGLAAASNDALNNFSDARGGSVTGVGAGKEERLPLPHPFGNPWFANYESL